MIKYFLVICLFLVCFPTYAHARQTMTLQPSHVYEFSGLDARVVSHIDVTGTGRYQFVMRDGDGDITRFGFSAGRFSVSGVGTAEITPLSPISVAFDSSRVRVTSREGTALHRILLEEDTITLENTGTERIQIRTDAADYFDFSAENRSGVVTHFERATRVPVLSIPAGGMITISAEILEVYLPYSLWQIDVLVKTAPSQALQRLELISGNVYNFTNMGDTTYTLRMFSDYDFFAYEYVLRGRDGHVLLYGESDTEIRLAARQTIRITALADGELYFPYVWLDELVVEGGESLPANTLLQSGQSIEVINSDPLREHMVFLRCYYDSEFSFEYVTLYDDELFLNIVTDFIGLQASVTIPAESMVVITAQSPILASVPYVAAVSARSDYHHALVRHSLSPAVLIENNYDMDIPFSVYSLEKTAVDYVLRDEDGTILSFGRIPHEGEFLLEIGQSAVFSGNADLIFPRIAEINLHRHNSPALHRHILSHGEVLQIDNIGRTRNRLLLVQNETDEYGDFAYDFVMSQGNDVLDYGFGGFGWYLLPVNRRITVMPQEDVTLSVAFPTEWYGRELRLRRVTEEPLYRISIAPGRSVVFQNRAATSFALANNSRITQAGFHIAGAGEWVRQVEQVVVPGEVIHPADLFPPGWSLLFDELGISLDPIYTNPRVEHVARDVYVPRHTVDVRNDAPEEGDIILPASGRITVTAALGEDLEIWLPRSWVRQMRISR